MSFDIHLFDKLNPESGNTEELLHEYSDALLDDFFASPEGIALREQHPDASFWSFQFIQYGYDYLGVPLTRITRAHAEELLAEIFPRKISLNAAKEADVAIPELKAFWQYLRREHKLTQADAILALLEDVAPNFRRWMNDPSKFGMAKSFFMAGQAAGFDMTNEGDVERFMAAYNASLPAGGMPTSSPALQPPLGGLLDAGGLGDGGWGDPEFRRAPSRGNTSDKKKKRKAAEASRKKNRKRK